MMKLNRSEVLKRINGHPDCAAEFVLCNQEVDHEDRSWMIKEANRSFTIWGIPIIARDVEFNPLIWHIEEASP
jgi:hypothetical protein